MRLSSNWRSDAITARFTTNRFAQSQPTKSNCRWLGQVVAVASLLFCFANGQPLFANEATEVFPEYGAMTTVGQSLEPCETEAQFPGAKVLSPGGDWQATIAAGQPGDTFLLHGGTYQATGKPLVLPAGEPGRPITIKPYNCAAVTVYASLRPRSHNVIAGLQVEAKGIDDARWLIRVDGKMFGHIEQVTIRNNTLWGGTTDAIRVLGDTAYVEITGNQIDGGGNGHVIFITAEDQNILPDQISVTNNLLTKAYFQTASEDMFQVRDVRHVLFSHNTCTNGYAMEQCVDIKSTQVALVISHNLFDGDQLHLGNVGEDGADGCMVIHEFDGDPQPHLIEHNFFQHCKGTVIRFAAAAPERGEISSGIVVDNLITAAKPGDTEIPVFQARNVEFNHNTLVNAHIKLGDANHSRTPQNTTFRNNIIYQTTIDDHASPAGTAIACTHNLLFGVDGNNFDPNACANSITADPQFVDAATGNFQLQPDSPANAPGDDGRGLGAAIISVPPPPPANNLIPQIFLPLLLRK